MTVVSTIKTELDFADGPAPLVVAARERGTRVKNVEDRYITMTLVAPGDEGEKEQSIAFHTRDSLERAVWALWDASKAIGWAEQRTGFVRRQTSDPAELRAVAAAHSHYASRLLDMADSLESLHEAAADLQGACHV